LRTIWNVIGSIRGSEAPKDWVVAGNHRDAWVYGAVDPNSGTAAMLESVHGIGELLKSGWKPKRTMVFGSWDAEEEGLIGSTEWGEQHEADLAHAAAYFNVDVAVSGPKFGASSIPSLKQFLRDITKVVPSPKGGTVYDAWLAADKPGSVPVNTQETSTSTFQPPAAQAKQDAPVGDLGSGSDYTVFQQHLGVPSSDIGSTGDYGVYHSVFDNFSWFTKFGDPDFVYEQQMARVFGLQAIRMADADVLPYNYEEYGKEIALYIGAAHKKSDAAFGAQSPGFVEVTASARRFEEAGAKILGHQRKPGADSERLNQLLLATERALLIPEGLPRRAWYRHAIYAPGEYTGYAAVVIPGVNEAIDRHDLAAEKQQITALRAALDRAAKVLESYR
jgi:N-acetylated-alpha-linked acidic dipeptidase